MTRPNAPQAQPAPPAVQPRKVKKTPTIPDQVAELEDWFINLKRSFSGYMALRTGLLSFQDQTPEGERRMGLPILKFSAPAPNGREAIEVVTDLRKVDPQYIAHVMCPLINAQAGEMVESLDEIEYRVGMLKQALGKLLGEQNAAVSDEEEEQQAA